MSSVEIEFTGGHGIRVIDQYEWNPENGHVQSVDVQTAANLISYPIPDQFRVRPGQPYPTKAFVKALAGELGVEIAEVEALFSSAPPPPAPKLTDLPGLSAERAAELAGKGVTGVAALATLNEEGIAALAAGTGASRGEIEAWVGAAKRLA